MLAKIGNRSSESKVDEGWINNEVNIPWTIVY